MLEKKRIMVIDDNVTNLNIARSALEECYELLLIPSGEKALHLVGKLLPQLILLDLEMPTLSGFEVIAQLKAAPSPVCDIPTIFLTAQDDNGSELEGLDLGAVDYIKKPFSFPLLRKRVELHLALEEQRKALSHYSANLERMVEEKTREITQLQNAIVRVMSDMVERRDGSTGGHLLRTQNYLRVLIDAVRQAGPYAQQLRQIDTDMLVEASQLHDVGKISIPDAILLKEGHLLPVEFEMMKTHTTLGAQAIRAAMASVQNRAFLQTAAVIAGLHHERWDGTGYPEGLAGEEIPLPARLMAIADVYDALISERPYKRAFSHSAAVQIIREEAGTHFDPRLVEAFAAVAQEFEEITQIYQDEPALARFV